MRNKEDMLAKCIEKGLKVREVGIDGMMATWGKRTVIASWEDMCELKDIFWEEEETVVQFHPAKSDYVNNLQHCLHLWKPIEKYSGKLPIPDSLLVGIKGLELN